MRERKIGEVFGLADVILRVEETPNQCSCHGCYFIKPNSRHLCYEFDIKSCRGTCLYCYRSDGKNVIFVEVRDDKEKEYQQ